MWWWSRVIEPWVWLWGCRSGLGVVVCVLVSAWWWSRGCGGVLGLPWVWLWGCWVGCGGLRFGLGVVVEPWVWVWLWGGCRWIEEGGEK
uniref:Uncharacterized protein n=1 Tax=Fagus sylvatica TaxID=28930 RepID=A0A2N9IWN0_FAGSY